MKLSRNVAVAGLLTAAFVPLTASSASAGPTDEAFRLFVDTYCDVQEATGTDNVQDCRFLIQ